MQLAGNSAATCNRKTVITNKSPELIIAEIIQKLKDLLLLESTELYYKY